MNTKVFPVLNQPFRRGKRIETVPWSVGECAYKEYSRRYGKSQSIERIAERGGFSESELDLFCPGWRDQIGS
jgi:hypothetical protein